MKHKQNNKGGWIKHYLIIVYLFSIIVFGLGIYQVYQTPTEEKWEPSECPKINNHRFIDAECEKNIAFNEADKAAQIVVLLFFMMVAPIGALIVVFALVGFGTGGEEK
jgi:hypothetical protein